MVLKQKMGNSCRNVLLAKKKKKSTKRTVMKSSVEQVRSFWEVMNHSWEICSLKTQNSWLLIMTSVFEMIILDYWTKKASRTKVPCLVRDCNFSAKHGSWYAVSVQYLLLSKWADRRINRIHQEHLLCQNEVLCQEE